MYQGGELGRHRNLTICSLAHCQPSLKISCKSVRKFFPKVAKRQTNNDERISRLAEVMIGNHQRASRALVKAKFHYASWFGAGSEHVRS